MNDRIDNQNNPLAQGDADELRRRLVSLMREPAKDTRTDEEKQQFEQYRKRRAAEYQEARYGTLPPNTYRILEQGSFMGWHYELEVAHNTYTLSRNNESEFALFGDSEAVIDIAKEKLARLIGDAAAEKAEFRFVFGGQL